MNQKKCILRKICVASLLFFGMFFLPQSFVRAEEEEGLPEELPTDKYELYYEHPEGRGELKENKNFIYCYNETYKGIEILKYKMAGRKWKVKELKIPKQIDNKPVTALADYSFFYCRYAKKVVLPKTVTDIGAMAFWACGVDSNSALRLEIPKNSRLKKIGGEAFAWSSIELLKLPDSLQIIDGSFEGCGKLKKVILGKKTQLREMQSCFIECKTLTEITIPKTVKKMGGTFSICPNLKKITFQGAPPKYIFRSFNGIHPDAVFHVPKKYKKQYRKLLKKAEGYKSTMKIL